MSSNLLTRKASIMNRPLLAILAATLALGGCMTQQSPQAMTAPVAATMVTDSSQFVPMATSSNLLEIESSRLALRRSRDPDVRRFADRMVRDHTMATRQMAQTVRAAGLPPAPPSMTPRHRAMLDELAATPAGEFDAAYVAAQARAHDEAIALFSSYAENGDNPRLVNFARQTLPKLEMHAEQVAALEQRIR
jgi:putative membrane protein